MAAKTATSRLVEERFERVQRQLEKLAMLATATAAEVIAQDEQIDELVKVALKQRKDLEQLRRELEQLRREFAAYLTAIHPRQ